MNLKSKFERLKLCRGIRKEQCVGFSEKTSDHVNTLVDNLFPVVGIVGYENTVKLTAVFDRLYRYPEELIPIENDLDITYGELAKRVIDKTPQILESIMSYGRGACDEFIEGLHAPYRALDNLYSFPPMRTLVFERGSEIINTIGSEGLQSYQLWSRYLKSVDQFERYYRYVPAMFERLGSSGVLMVDEFLRGAGLRPSIKDAELDELPSTIDRLLAVADSGLAEKLKHRSGSYFHFCKYVTLIEQEGGEIYSDLLDVTDKGTHSWSNDYADAIMKYGPEIMRKVGKDQETVFSFARHLPDSEAICLLKTLAEESTPGDQCSMVAQKVFLDEVRGRSNDSRQTTNISRDYESHSPVVDNEKMYRHGFDPDSAEAEYERNREEKESEAEKQSEIDRSEQHEIDWNTDW
jgi:hypothetical protein